MVVAVSVSAAVTDDVDVKSGQSAFVASGYSVDDAGSNGLTQAASSAGVEVITVEEPACLGGAETCGEPAFCDDGSPMIVIWYQSSDGNLLSSDTSCPVEAGQAATAPQVTPGMVAAAFQRIPLPESELNVQPPNGRTLVNFDTNFYTEGGEFTRTITLLGRQVELRIWPSRFGWQFGDGRSTWTTTPGAKYPDLEITHRYLEKGRVTPSVDTTYAAQFRVGNGPWRDVVGTVTIPGTPEGLRVVTARPVLVGG